MIIISVETETEEGKEGGKKTKMDGKERMRTHNLLPPIINLCHGITIGSQHLLHY